MIPGETILCGASPHCDVCGEPYEFAVMHTGAGYYIGTACCMGPWTRESRYWNSKDEADAALSAWRIGVTVGARG